MTASPASWRPSPEEPPRRSSGGQVVAISLALSVLVFLIDALTPQRLVVSILQDVPIALTGLTRNRRLTVAMVLFGILSNILAEAINAHEEGSVSAIAIGNRFFSVLSFLLVGYLAIRIQERGLETGRTLSEKMRGERDRKIRSLLEELSREGDSRTLLARIAPRLRTLFGARGLIFAGIGRDRWTDPLLTDPPSLFFWKAGDSLPGALALLGEAPLPPQSISKLSLDPLLENNGARGGLLARLSLKKATTGECPDLLLFLLDPEDPEALAILREILPVLEELLGRLELLRHLQETNLQLLRKNAMIQDLVSGLSHDIRTPLLAQNMNFRLAQKGVFGPVSLPLARLLDQAVASNGSLLDQANRLLLLTRYELDDPSLEWSSVPLAEILDEAIGEILPLARDKGVTLLLQGGAPAIEGDRVALKRLFLNLLDNALKWSPPQGEIRVCSEEKGELVAVTVSDQGPGVPPEMVPRLFRRFGGLRPGSGFGLGLYLSNQIAALHGGSIRYAPGAPGSLLTVDLPKKRRALS